MPHLFLRVDPHPVDVLHPIVRAQPLSLSKAYGGVAGRRVTIESNLSDIAENAASFSYFLK